jgi:hypothetical protein
MNAGLGQRVVPGVIVATIVGLLAGPSLAVAQIPGENVNMVSGRGWPGGDPFLQRQNEPSIAVSSANPEHLLAGANDYRSVDLARSGSADETGDAWLGVFKSFDGGQTWKSYLMPGYPLDPAGVKNELSDCTPVGMAVNSIPCSAGADPVVRAGPDGMFYFSGIVFKRGTNYGKVVLTRWLDSNSKENGDPLQGKDTVSFLGAAVIDVGTGTTFADKAWIAVDVPRAGAPVCADTGKPAGNVYVVWTRIYSTTPQTADILFTRSSDCGHTWSAPVTLNKNNSKVSQGAVIAIDPPTGDVYVAWRRYPYAPKNQTDGIVVVRSFHFGRKFTPERVVAPILPFDMDSSGTAFRSEAFPTMAISVAPGGKQSWVHVAWAARATPNGDGRIWMSSAPVKPPPSDDNEDDDDLSGWSAPALLDGAPLADGSGNTYTRGHQFFPQLTFSQGRLMAVYYDSRLDHTRKYFTPYVPFRPDPVTGSFYAEARGPLGELVANPALVWDIDLDEKLLIDAYNADPDQNRDSSGKHRRHTVDVRVGRALPGPSPAFTSVQVSKMPFGEPTDLQPGAQADIYGPGGALGKLALTGLDAASPYVTVKVLQELGANPPNLPMFAQGTVPFMGDYIDIQGPAFVKSARGWAFNTEYAPAPVFHAIWTSNQDVRPPPNGDWTKYTPVRLLNADGTPISSSKYDPTQAVAACEPGFEATRDQNIYTSRITEGLVVSSPQNAKPLSSAVTRAFVVLVQNTTDVKKPVKISVAPPSGVSASFQSDGPLQSFDVWVPPHSHVYRALFVKLTSASGDPGATLVVNVAEVNPNSPASCIDGRPAVPCALVGSGGLAGSVTLNPPGSNPDLIPPDGDPGNVKTLEIYAANIGSANIGSANIGSANIGSANIGSFNITNANIGSANIGSANIGSSGISASHIANYSVANIGSANIGSANIGSANIGSANFATANIGSANIGSANIGSANIGSAAISDANYAVTNTGNTTMSYHVVLVGSGTTPPPPLQLILSKQYANLVAADCTLAERPANRVVLSIDDPYVVSDPTQIVDPNIPDPSPRNATIAIAPGETAQITIRGPLNVPDMTQLASQLTPVAVPHSGGVMLDPTTRLPQPSVGAMYAANIRALGGKGPLTWSVTGTLPPGITYQPSTDTQSLLLGGLPTMVAPPSTFTVQVGDARGSVTQSFTLSVVQGTPVVTLVTTPAAAVHGQSVSVTITVAPQATGGTVPSGTVQLFDGSVNGPPLASGPVDVAGSLSVTIAAPTTGLHTLSAVYSGNGNYLGGASASVGLTVARASSATGVSSSFADGTSVYGQQVTLQAKVTAAPPGAGTPTGNVTFSDATGPLAGGVVALVAGVATFPVPGPLPGGTSIFSASYGGDPDFTTSTSPSISQLVKPVTPTAFNVSQAGPASYGQTVGLLATVGPTPTGGKAPGGSVTFVESATLGTSSVVDGVAVLGVALPGGTHLVGASYSGDANYGPTTLAAPAAVFVSAASDVAAMSSSANASTFGQSVTFGMQVLTGSNLPVTEGVVSFYDGALLLNPTPIPLDGTGTASYTATGLPAGTHAITGRYLGTANFQAINVTLPGVTTGTTGQVVNPAATTATLVASANPVSYGSGVTFTCRVAVDTTKIVPIPIPLPIPSGSVQFAVGGVTVATVPLDGTGAATWPTSTLPAGTSVVTCVYPYTSSPNFLSSGSNPIAEVANNVSTTTTLTSSPFPPMDDKPFTLTATVTTTATGSPTGTVTFKDGTSRTLGTVTLTAAMGGKASLLVGSTSEGSHTFSAAYSGDTTYAGSTGTFTVKVLEDYACDAYDSPLVRGSSATSPSYSGAKTYGTTVAVRFRFRKPTGAYVSRTTAIQELKAVQDTACTGKPPAGAASRVLYSATGGLTPGNTLNWESGTGYYNLGWATSSASRGCWVIVLTPDNGVPQVATYLKLQ